jgi:hypothetical protein
MGITIPPLPERVDKVKIVEAVGRETDCATSASPSVDGEMPALITKLGRGRMLLTAGSSSSRSLHGRPDIMMETTGYQVTPKPAHFRLNAKV